MKNIDYKSFLEKKKKKIVMSGISNFKGISFNQYLFPYQLAILKKALNVGRYAIFAECGLGKTIIQLEWARLISNHTGGKVIILAPLAVVDQTKKEAKKFGIDIPRIDVTNYEQLKNISPGDYNGVVLDESSILKNFTGKYRNLIIDTFKSTPYKLCCTATPAPNDPMELGNHSEFLNHMSRLEMLSMYFVHDGGETSKWRLKGHAISDFYKYVSNWAVVLSKPSDIGFNDKDHILGDLEFNEYRIKTPPSNNLLFNDIAVNATNFNQELRRTYIQRMDKAIELSNRINGQLIIWVRHNKEANYLNDRIPDSINIQGSSPPEFKKKHLLGFANNEFRVLITKPKIAQFGLNYQNCSNQIFASIGFSFESVHQAVRRSYRFGQDNKVTIHIITTDTMSNVITSINKKMNQFNHMREAMVKNQQTWDTKYLTAIV